MNTQHPLAYLWANIADLMGAKPDQPGLLDRVQSRTKVGRGTIQRIQKAPGQLASLQDGVKPPSVELNSLVAIAAALGVQAWELLKPRPAKTASRPSRDFVLASLVDMASDLTDEELVNLAKSVRYAITIKRKGETTTADAPIAGVYFLPERRTHDDHVDNDRRGGKSWMVHRTQEGEDLSPPSPPSNQKEEPI